jgi:1,4-alpha-glucan branching enzyme
VEWKPLDHTGILDMAASQTGISTSTPIGATLLPGGVTFRLWAPTAQQVFVLTGPSLAAVEQTGFNASANDAMVALGDGTWGAFVPGLGEGAAYRFWVIGSGSTGFKRDPRARELGTVPPYPNSDCLVRDPSTYPWHDAGFRAPEFRDLIQYQLHIGVYSAVDARGHDKRRSIGKFLDLLDRIDYLHDLGINAVQLLPIQEYPSETSEGYNGLDLFSPELDYHIADDTELTRYLQKANAFLARHGIAALQIDDLRPGPNQLKCVIDIFHLAGIAVMFDLVFNHVGPGFNDQSLWFLDRQPYGDDNRSLYCTDHQWVGGRLFAYWNASVRQFLIDNAVQSIEEYHIDGIRYDEVTVIDNNGGGLFCQDLTSTVRFVKPQAIQTAEYWAGDRAAAVRPRPDGLGFDASWGDKLREGIRAAIAQASGGRDAYVDIDALAGAFDIPTGLGEAWRIVNCIENHDVVFDGNRPRIAALADPSNHRSWYARSRARVAAGLLFAGRGIPMLFMGEEILEDKQWRDDTIFHANLLIWWDGLNSDRAMQDYLHFCRDLVWLRRNNAALRSEMLRVAARNSTDRVISIHRWIDGVGLDVLVVANLQEVNRFGYRVGFPVGGRWHEIFNSDFYDQFPNPQTVGNGGSIESAVGINWDGMPSSAAINLPANGFIVFAR